MTPKIAQTDAACEALMELGTSFGSSPDHLMSRVVGAARELKLLCTSAIFENAGYPHHNCHSPALMHLDFIPELGRVMELDAGELQALAHPVIRQNATARIVDYFGVEVPSYDLVLRTRRTVPHARLINGRYPASWTHGLVGFCPTTGLEIIHQCPLCENSLGWRNVVEHWQCDVCGEDMREVDAKQADQSEQSQASAALDLLSPNRAVRSRAETALHPELGGLRAGGALDLAWRLAMATQADAPESRKQQTQLCSEAKLTRAVEAARILFDWPGRADALLRDTAGRAANGNSCDFVRLKSLLMRTPHFPSIQALAQERWVLNRHARAVLTKLDTDLVYGNEAVQLSGVTASDFAAIAKAGIPPAASARGIVRSGRSFRRQDIIELRRVLDDSTPYDAAAAMLGITKVGLEQLDAMGLVKAVNHPALNLLGRTPAVSGASIAQLKSSLIEHRKDPSFVEHGILASRLFLSIGGRPKPWGPLVALLLSGSVPFGFEDECNLSKLVVPAKSARSILSLEFDCRLVKPGRRLVTFTRMDVIEYLNLNPNGWDIDAIMRIAKEKFSSYPVDRQAIERVGRSHISKREINARLTILNAEPMARTTRPWAGLTDAGWSRSMIEEYLGLDAGGIDQDFHAVRSSKMPTQLKLGV